MAHTKIEALKNRCPACHKTLGPWKPSAPLQRHYCFSPGVQNRPPTEAKRRREVAEKVIRTWHGGWRDGGCPTDEDLAKVIVRALEREWKRGAQAGSVP